MEYMLMLYSDQSAWSTMTPQQQEQGIAAYAAYTEALKKAAIFRAGNRLRPTSSATTVRVGKDKVQVLDGPYADSKEQLAGYYLVDVPDLDAAISWASRCPGANHGTVEVRPIWPEGRNERAI